MKRSPLIRKTALRRIAMKRTRKVKPLRRVYSDGREVLSGMEWTARKVEVWFLDSGRCKECSIRVENPIQGREGAAEIHHVFGRGMAGGFRNDAVWADKDKGVRNLIALCRDCHRRARMKSKRPSKNAELR